MFTLPSLLLADISIGAIILIVLGILYGIGQVMNREQKRPAPRRRPQRPPGGQLVAQAQNPRDEVERFLREVTAHGRAARGEHVELLQKPEARAQPQPPRRPPTRPLQQQPARSQPPAHQRAVVDSPLEAEVVPQSLDSGVRDHVRTHLGPGDAGLGVGESVHEHLDRRVGTIASARDTRTAARGRAAAGLPAHLLRSTAGLRHAIILTEILAEPVSLRQPR